MSGRPVRAATVGSSALPDDPARTVDPATESAHLESAGPGRAVLVDSTGTRTRVVLGPVQAGSRGEPPTVEVVVDGWRFVLSVEDATRAELRERAEAGRSGPAAGGPLEVRAVIPGRIVSVAVTPGDEVTAGQVLLVVEAMKMQNDLRAPRAGTVAEVFVGAGVTVEVGDRLVVLE